MSEIFYIHFRNGESYAVNELKKFLLKTLLCISGGNEEMRSEMIKEIYSFGNGTGEKIYLTDETEQGVFPNIILAQDRNKYLKKHIHQGLFFQQRFQSAYADRGDTVQDMILEAQKQYNYRNFYKLLEALEIQLLLKKPLIQLSSGEWQRYTFALNIIKNPEILLFEDGLKGLDSNWRSKIAELFMSDELPTPVLIFTSDSTLDEIPPEKHLHLYQEKTHSVNSPAFHPIPDTLKKSIEAYQTVSHIRETIIEMKGVNIKYGPHQVLRNIQWTVKRGERWKVQGHNGAGKSTLLSLIYGDNPQAYSQPLYLFGKKKGSGQSIWELKSQISYFSSDLFQYYHSTKSGYEVILSELKTPHITSKLPSEKFIREVTAYFGITEQLNTLFSRLRPNIRRQILLIATYLKSSALIILDEPYHGFDNDRIEQNNRFIEYLLNHSHQTILFVSHFAKYFPKSISKKLVLKNGKIEEISHHQE